MLTPSTKFSRLAFLCVFFMMAVTSLVRNEVFQGTTNVINWDGYGYYVYLPGIFIYGDINEYEFSLDHFGNYDVSTGVYQLNETDSGEQFPIYNIGLSVIWTPAFLLTHGIVSATGIAPADGMSYPYQLMIVLMGILFAFLGLLYLKRFLALYFSDLVVAATLVAIGLGTNIFYYIAEKPDMTHGYLFALYAIFLYYFARSAEREFSRGELIRLGLLAGLMCLVRSSEIVLFAIPAFYGLRNASTLERNIWRTLFIFVITLVVFSIQLAYYKIGTGSWWQDGYAGLGFDWLEPHLFDGFFSYRRGWLVYAPIMLFALIGISRLPKRWILPVTIFLLGNVYILFSWHIWWYGNTFGSRPVTQSHALLALPLAAFLAWVMGSQKGSESPISNAISGGAAAGTEVVKKAGSWRSFIPLLIVPFVLLNLFQHWQYNQRIIPLDFSNGTYYWNVFGKTKLNKKDRVYLDTDEKIPRGDYASNRLFQIDTLVPIAPWAVREFTNLMEYKVTAEEARQRPWLSTKVVFSYYGDLYDKWKFPSVVTEHRRGDEILKWVQVKIPPTMDTPELDSMSFNLSLPDLQEGDIVKQYIWNLCQDKMDVRNYAVDFLIEE